ncbi:hypothetical protein BEN74_04850 [Acinetobacter sp. WCHAc010034]|uniref:hypothetical protein n=1 Tax=Acinetobacter sp. WCHAc010034 TaxID=1879049 RepID=UPI00083B9F8A|nr:hypothetical protein [Acinetobacter sp. WCHAc010034]AYA02267.1 hypothetical protein BEN74_04850 [Acinetobacter sp. WCHAc010034]
MDIELKRKTFGAWHESEYGEHIIWLNGSPVSHIHNDRWQGWLTATANAQAVPEANALLGATLDAAQKLGSGDFVLVPREPTEAMQDAGCSVMPTVDCQPYDAGVVYKKMIEAQLGLPAPVLQSLMEVS